MRTLLFSSLAGLALITFTGCTDSDDAQMKCQTGKCQGAKAKKCGGEKAASKCQAIGK